MRNAAGCLLAQKGIEEPEGFAGFYASAPEGQRQSIIQRSGQPDADNFVFNSQKSTKLNRITVFKLFKAIARKADLGDTLQHLHVLKHTAAMVMVQQGANAFLIRQHLGHRFFDSTLA